MQDFRKLKIWEKSHSLVIEIYKYTCSFPKEEIYGLTSQIRRAAVSIPANIAEGCVKGSDLEFGRFLKIALGSASELEYHVLLAKELQFLTNNDYDVLSTKVVEVKRMLTAFCNKLKAEDN
jgi:four helix bundle protein